MEKLFLYSHNFEGMKNTRGGGWIVLVLSFSHLKDKLQSGLKQSTQKREGKRQSTQEIYTGSSNDLE
jgi:hypothetical protein